MVLTPTIRESILRMVAGAFPALVFGHPRTYVVQSVNADKTLDLEPPPDARHLPELRAVEQWGLGKVTPAAGSEVCVLFRDANPSRPIVVPWGFASTPEKVHLDVTDELDLGPSATREAARINDTVVSPLTPATFVGTIGSSPASGMIIFSPPQTTGNITTGASKVKVSSS